VIDAGHGGKDPGTHGAVAKEKTIALKVALEVGKLIKANLPGVKVIYTRSTDVFVPLDDRADIANRNKADLFISIHCNANPVSADIHGTETYTMGLHKSEDNLEVANRENSVILQETGYEKKYDGFDPDSPVAYILFSNYQSAFIENSLVFAQSVENQFKSRVGRKSRGVRQAGFLVLWKTTMPGALVEIGYLTNPAEEKYLVSQQGQSFIASGIYRAFKEYKKAMEE
jgi:N-acetylmuramoyl-L-alanine amidase